MVVTFGFPYMPHCGAHEWLKEKKRRKKERGGAARCWCCCCQFNKKPRKGVFDVDPQNDTREVKLEDVNVPANPPSSATKGSEEGSSPRASLSDIGNPNAVFSDAGNETSSSEPEQTRSKNVQNGGSGLISQPQVNIAIYGGSIQQLFGTRGGRTQF